MISKCLGDPERVGLRAWCTHRVQVVPVEPSDEEDKGGTHFSCQQAAALLNQQLLLRFRHQNQLSGSKEFLQEHEEMLGMVLGAPTPTGGAG